MSIEKYELLARIGSKCGKLEELALSYRHLEQMAKKDGSTQEFAALVDAIGTVTLSNLSDTGNLLEALLKESAE